MPEAESVLAQGPSVERKESYPPKNAQVRQLSGDEAQKVIEYALSHNTSRQLQTSLHNFHPQKGEALAISISWIDEKTKEYYTGVAVAIPFKNETNTEAYLYYSSINNDVQFAVARPLVSGQKIEAVDVYQVKNNVIDVNRITTTQKVSTRSSGLCTVECMVQCLQLYGCSGYAIAVCMASIIACVVAPPACIIAFACSLYCGGAFQNCFENICCADA